MEAEEAQKDAKVQITTSAENKDRKATGTTGISVTEMEKKFNDKTTVNLNAAQAKARIVSLLQNKGTKIRHILLGGPGSTATEIFPTSNKQTSHDIFQHMIVRTYEDSAGKLKFEAWVPQKAYKQHEHSLQSGFTINVGGHSYALSHVNVTADEDHKELVHLSIRFSINQAMGLNDPLEDKKDEEKKERLKKLLLAMNTSLPNLGEVERKARTNLDKAEEARVMDEKDLQKHFDMLKELKQITAKVLENSKDAKRILQRQNDPEKERISEPIGSPTKKIRTQ